MKTEKEIIAYKLALLEFLKLAIMCKGNEGNILEDLKIEFQPLLDFIDWILEEERQN